MLVRFWLARHSAWDDTGECYIAGDDPCMQVTSRRLPQSRRERFARKGVADFPYPSTAPLPLDGLPRTVAAFGSPITEPAMCPDGSSRGEARNRAWRVGPLSRSSCGAPTSVSGLEQTSRLGGSRADSPTSDAGHFGVRRPGVRLAGPSRRSPAARTARRGGEDPDATTATRAPATWR